MDDNSTKNSSVGRARGHSMLSSLKATTQEPGVGIGEDLQRHHPGISFDSLRSNHRIGNVTAGASVGQPSLITATGRVVSESRVGADSGPPPIVVTPSVPGEDAPPDLSADSGSESDRENPFEAVEEIDDYYHNPDLRKWCTGQPPKMSYLSSNPTFLPRLRTSRRNTLADKPELDALLAATKVEYNGHYFLPLTAQTIHRLDPFFKGAKPLADMNLFECIVITQEVNGVHADHVVAALERIGEHCKHLLVMSPVHTSELGNVFARETGLIEPGNDWDAILGCFPNLQYLAFVHDIGEPIALIRNTFLGLQQAVANRQASQKDSEGRSFNGPTALLM